MTTREDQKTTQVTWEEVTPKKMPATGLCKPENCRREGNRLSVQR